jgi:hypothetical protein
MRNILCATLIGLFFTSWTFAQTEGVLTVTATTSSTGGTYAPKNIVAIWIENEQGNFVKTLLAYAETRKTHLNTWEASTTAAGSPFNTVDAITGATRSSHGTRTCTWNGTNVSGSLVADGTYKVRMELTDKNNTGNFSTFTFIKGIDPQNLTPANVPSFSTISLVWQPVITSVSEEPAESQYHIYPNPTSGIFQVSGEGILEVEIRDAAGSLIYKGNSASPDITGKPNGIYYVKITTEKGSVVKKVVKNVR